MQKRRLKNMSRRCRWRREKEIMEEGTRENKTEDEEVVGEGVMEDKFK
jgi:hypothetical protein